ncbi:hypothetical protein EYZ11_006277 [Aspergillus tanneri]|uniref:Uncharacterized protein n=1 Tax=Aspergillus tanneri TaxID=1220188 RepID=A0A4S3JFS2_9EURO|nr:hypothetical protein EYZ11_006277 [Aspergillus tanneri]
MPMTEQYTLADGYSTLTAGGQGVRVCWFLFAEMGQTYFATSIPRFTQRTWLSILPGTGT